MTDDIGLDAPGARQGVNVSNLPDLYGVWGYIAGTSGSETVTGRVLSISAHSTAGGSMTIDGGDSIVIPANSSIGIAPQGNLIDPVLVFTTTDSYFVEFLT